jgi:hypothetical protein
MKAPRDKKSSGATPPQQVLQRKCACGSSTSGGCAECAAKRRLDRSASTEDEIRQEAPAVVHEALRTSGEPIEPESCVFFEQAFGHNFSRVRVHTDQLAARSAKAVNAHAFTVGEDIVFADGQYAPRDAAGALLIAHELAHVVQQRAMSPSDTSGLRVSPTDASSENEADRAANAVMSRQAPHLSPGSVAPRVARRGPVPAPVRPPVRPAPARPAGPGTSAPGRPAPWGGPSPNTPMWVPEPSDDSLDATLQRGSIKDYAERQRIAQERPVATLERGGSAPDFITEHGTRQHSWLGGPAGGGSVTVRIRKFHVLDRIQYDVGRATTEEQLQSILEEHAPIAAGLNENIAEMERRTRGLPSSFPSLMRPMHNFFDAPVYPANFDPRAEARLATFTAAVEKRSSAVPEFAKSRLKSPAQRKGGCMIEPIEPLGDDPLSSLYCHLVTASPFSYKITILGANGQKTQRWAEIDSLRGNTWYECKCGYEKLLADESRGAGTARSILAKLDKQVLNHADIARTCGLTYRYVVSSERVADILRERWSGNVTIYVVSVDLCD